MGVTKRVSSNKCAPHFRYSIPSCCAPSREAVTTNFQSLLVWLMGFEPGTSRIQGGCTATEPSTKTTCTWTAWRHYSAGSNCLLYMYGWVSYTSTCTCIRGKAGLSFRRANFSCVIFVPCTVGRFYTQDLLYFLRNLCLIGSLVLVSPLATYMYMYNVYSLLFMVPCSFIKKEQKAQRKVCCALH